VPPEPPQDAKYGLREELFQGSDQNQKTAALTAQVLR